MDKKLLQDIIMTPSPTGYEDGLPKLLANYFADKADKFMLDNQGSLTSVYNPNADFKLMIAAHADEISLVVNGYNSNGSLTVGRNGDISPKLYVGTKVRIITKEGIIHGVVGTNNVIEEKAKVECEDLFIDIGCDKEDDSKAVVPLGSYVIHDTDLVELQNNQVSARAFDDRLGVFITQCAAWKAKKAGAKIGIYCTATTGEENTGRGAYSSSALIKPDVSLIVDVTFSTDYAGAKMPGEVKLGKGGVICLGSIPNRRLNDLLAECAKELNKPVQYEVWTGRTGTDGDTIVKVNHGEPVVLFSIPLRYMHSPVEVASYDDIESMIDIIALFICKLNKDMDLKPYTV